MENGVYSVPVNMFGRSCVGMDGIETQLTSSSLVVFDSFNHGNQNTASASGEYKLLQGEPINDLYSDIHSANRSAAMGLDAIASSVARHVTRDTSLGSCHIDSIEFQDQLVGGTPISDASLAALLANRNNLQENLNNYVISGPSVYPLEAIRTCVSNDCSNALSTSFASAANYERVEGFRYMNDRGHFERVLCVEDVSGRNYTARAALQPYQYMGNLESCSWISSQGLNAGADNPYGSTKSSNELSLSLATTPPSAVNGTSIPDQCSEINLRHHCQKVTRLSSEQTSSSSKELSLSCGSNRAGQFSQVISASRYLHVIQEILAQIASYSLENLDLKTLYTAGSKTGKNIPFSSRYSTERRITQMGCEESQNVKGNFEVRMDPGLQKRALEAKKAQLLNLLQMVDDQYNQCLDEIHTVISAFHAATELDPQIHTRFALQTISSLYKNLRERISNQILSMGTHSDSNHTKGTEGSIETTSYFQKQWTLQQLKKKEQQLWRPQRGLPERSVSVLRAWMFQNFLHPYPKDAEKHLLAVKSGLTRSQVSNWFINARVRLWKPMIEEMYAEMNKQKARQNEEGNLSDRRSQISISSRRFNMN